MQSDDSSPAGGTSETPWTDEHEHTDESYCFDYVLSSDVRTLERELSAERLARERAERRLRWAANELLSCDYGDNPEKRGGGWTVFGWRDVPGIFSVVPYEKARRIYGASINEAIDALLPSPPPDAKGGE